VTEEPASIAEDIEEDLRERGIERVSVTFRDGVVTLAGEVENRYVAATVRESAARFAGVTRIVSRLKILPEAPGMESVSVGESLGDFELRAEETEDSSATDPSRAARTGEPWAPPTDPVLKNGPDGPEVLGGFTFTSMDEVSSDEDAQAEADAGERGDEAIAQDVRRELAEDSLTTDLDIHVEVRRGLVVLTGKVADLDDAEAAEEIARRVPGVVDVADHTTLID
jgi:osmotically-inducible protein OsmY